MAKVVDNYKGLKVLEITRQEMMDKLTRYGCLGICDMCNRPTSVGYYAAYRDWETDRKSTRLNSSHSAKSRMPSSA